MKIIKRDGRAVDYDREKICIAIEKANKEVMEEERANKQEIKEIVGYIVHGLSYTSLGVYVCVGLYILSGLSLHILFQK